MNAVNAVVMAPEQWMGVLVGDMVAEMGRSPSVSDIHKTDHILRVWDTARELCRRVGGDAEIVAAAVALHDLGRHHGLEIHGPRSAELAEPILRKRRFPPEKTARVLEAIAQHDYNFPPQERTRLESKILYDADKIDAFGVIGVYRHVLFVNSGRIQLGEVLDLLEQRWSGLTLAESKVVAEGKYRYITEYFRELLGETNRAMVAA